MPRNFDRYLALPFFVGALLGASNSSLAAAPPRVAPLAPAEAVPSGPPTWCAGVTVKAPSSTPTSLSLSSEVFGGMTLETLREVVLYACSAPADPSRHAWVQAVRQSVSNEYGLTNADNDRMMRLAARLHAGESRYSTPAPAQDPGCKQHAPLTAGTNQQRMTRALERVAIGCGDWLASDNRSSVPRHFGAEAPPYWVVDFEGGFGSQLAKAAFVNDVLKDFRSLSASARTDIRYYRPWVHASGVTLDDAAFRRELRTMRIPEASAMQAVLTFRKAMSRFEQQRRYLEAEAKKDATLGALFFTGPAAARAKWARESAASRPVFDAVLGLEARMKDQPGGMTGCAKQLFPAFQSWARAIAPSVAQTPIAELNMSDFLGSQLAYGLTLCGLNDEQAPVMDQVFGYYFYRSPTQRGSIAASYAGMVDAYNAARTGSSLPELPRPIVSPPSFGMSAHASYLPYDPTLLSSGVVASIKSEGANTRITFRSETRKIPKLECADTDKIWRVTPGGTVIHERRCQKVGDKTVTGAPSPVLIPTFAAGGVRAGNLMLYWQYPNGESSDRAWPVEVYGDKNRRARVNLLGAQL